MGRPPYSPCKAGPLRDPILYPSGAAARLVPKIYRGLPKNKMCAYVDVLFDQLVIAIGAYAFYAVVIDYVFIA